MTGRRRCVVIQTKYGPVRGQVVGEVTARDVQAIEEVAAALYRSRWTGGDPECNHESDGEGTCLGCGAEKR